MTVKTSDFSGGVVKASIAAMRQSDSPSSSDPNGSGQSAPPSLKVEDWLPGAIGMVVFGIGIWIAWPWLSSLVAGWLGG